jgi:hypothetical protein
LNRVIGEEAVIGGCSGNLTIALPSPSPTIAAGQSARALATVVAASFACVQIARPVVSTAPWRSKRRSIL